MADPPPNRPTLASAIRTRRRTLGLTQDGLAKLAGCGRIFVHALETGKTTVRLDKLVDVLQVLGLQLAVETGTGGLVARADV